METPMTEHDHVAHYTKRLMRDLERQGWCQENWTSLGPRVQIGDQIGYPEAQRSIARARTRVYNVVGEIKQSDPGT
jgi:hypothetical protein